ncbi:hypothetical protein L810_4907 [Burkholderia sp. AU4i]|nr:hypothetical protein L810_4907 [Burkholderia sp. AU4i]
MSPCAAAAWAAKSVMPTPTPSPTFARRRRAGDAVVLFTVIALDGKLATRPCRNPLRSCEACPRPGLPPPDARAGTTFVRRTGRTRRSGTQACRSVGKTQDGTSDSGDAPGTDAAVDRFVGAYRAAGCIARSCHAGGRFERPGTGATVWCAPFAGTAACPSRTTSRRGAHFTPGGAGCPGIGRIG